MEFSFLLLVIVLIVLIHFKISLKNKVTSIQKSVNELNDKLDKIIETRNTPNSIDTKVKTEDTTIKQSIATAISDIPSLKDRPASIPSVAKDVPQPIPSIKKEPSIPDTTKRIPATNEDKLTRNAAPDSQKAAIVYNVSKKEVSKRTTNKAIQPPKPGFWQRFKDQNPDLEKFIGENLINKLGILILVLGISYFVKYAIDKDWINEPGRVGIGILAGSLVLAIAHKLRKNYAAFSSVLVSGAIAIFYFTIAIGFHEYQLFSQTVAFIILVLITAFSCLISMSYNRIELAVLSLLGGFAVPFMISTGNSNYQVLFSYIAILDIGIFALAYFKKWNLVNILAFICTTLLFISWFGTDMYNESPHYKGAFLFSFLFYLIFIATNIINNVRNKGSFTTSQLFILAINTFVFYAIGMIILSANWSEFRGLFTAALAVLNLGYAWLLYKKFGLDKTAVYLLIGLTLSFITLAIPIQFEGNNITLFWAAEAVLLIWLAQKSKIKNYRFASGIVHILMIGSLFIDWIQTYGSEEIQTIIVNAIFITGVVAVASLIGVWYLLRKETVVLQKHGFCFNPVIYKKIAIIIAIIIGYFVGILEVGYQSYIYFGEEIYSIFILPVIYHLLYCAILCFVLFKNKTNTNHILINVIAIINIIVFTFFLSRLPFLEQEGNLIRTENSQLAFYFQYVALCIIGYFYYLLYKVNEKTGFLTSRIIIWIAAFLIIYTASSELIIHGLKIMNPQLNTAEINTIEVSNDSFDYFTIEEQVTDTLRLATFKIIKTALPVLWGVLAFVFLLIGIKKSIKDLRIIALTLLGITILKLFTYDISNVSETGKIVAFILLGVLILIISFVYQKIKVLVIDEKNIPEKEDEVT